MNAQVYATKDEVKEIVSQSTEQLSAIMSQFANDVSGSFDRLETRMDVFDAKQGEIDKKFNHLINTIDAFVMRIDRYETEQLARDNQFEKLLVWARKVSKKTGIPLESL